MKNFFNKIMGLGLLLFSTLNLNAQTEPQVAIGETIIFPHQDSLKATLERFGIRLIDFPEWATQCPKFKAELPDGGKKSPWEPYIDTTKGPRKHVVDTLTFDKEKNIVWVHGLNGSRNSLFPPGYATQYGVQGNFPFPARKATSYGIEGDAKMQLYNENFGITPAASNVNAYSKTYIPLEKRTEKDFVIGHSQGGIVAREWLRKIEKDPTNYPNLVHGLVTFGTPHDGAEILNNCRPNMGNKVTPFMDNACKSLGDAIVTPTINSNFWTSLLISEDMKTKLITTACNGIVNSIIPLALDNYYKATTLDYYKNAPFLTGYNNSTGHVEGLSEYELKVPVVQFFGEEEQPILWRFLSSTLKMGEDQIQSSQNLFFAYEKDDQIQLKVQDMIDHYKTQEYHENLKYEFHKKRSARTINILFRNARDKAKDNAMAYYRGWKWLSEANDYYLTDLVGGRVVSTSLECKIIDNIDCSRTASSPRMDPLAKNLKIQYNFVSTGQTCTLAPVNSMYKNYTHNTPAGPEFMGNCEGFRITFPTWKNTFYYKPNDGVVLAESAAKKIKVKVDPLIDHDIVIMPKTNHEQMKNSDATRKALNDLYNGANGEFFKTSLR
jgi:pimeloyl-ACP methyl ester carboxylesterase